MMPSSTANLRTSRWNWYAFFFPPVWIAYTQQSWIGAVCALGCLILLDMAMVFSSDSPLYVNVTVIWVTWLLLACIVGFWATRSTNQLKRANRTRSIILSSLFGIVYCAFLGFALFAPITGTRETRAQYTPDYTAGYRYRYDVALSYPPGDGPEALNGTMTETVAGTQSFHGKLYWKVVRTYAFPGIPDRVTVTYSRQTATGIYEIDEKDTDKVEHLEMPLPLRAWDGPGFGAKRPVWTSQGVKPGRYQVNGGSVYGTVTGRARDLHDCLSLTMTDADGTATECLADGIGLVKINSKLSDGSSAVLTLTDHER